MRITSNKIKAKLSSHLRVNEIPFNRVYLRGVSKVDDTLMSVEKLILTIDTLEINLGDLKSLIQEFEEKENIFIDSILIDI